MQTTPTQFDIRALQTSWQAFDNMAHLRPIHTAWAVARLSGAKVWLHIQDYEVDAAFSLKLLKGEWLRRAVLSAERWLMRRFDVVSTISGRMLALAGLGDIGRCSPLVRCQHGLSYFV